MQKHPTTMSSTQAQSQSPSLEVIQPPHSPTTVCSDDLILTERMMLEACSSAANNSDLLGALKYHLNSGGSRSRVRLCLHSSQALGLSFDDALVLAVSVELLHNASLVQDDLQDADATRRGNPAVWVKYGKNTALGLVDLMIASAFKNLVMLSDHQHLGELMNKLHEAIALTLEGQTVDTSTNENNRDVASCLKVARRKSGPLFALAIELPLIATNRHQYALTAHDAACTFGTGYQVYDDILDFDFDRRNSHSNNVVCALNEEHRIGASMTEAISIARKKMSHAKRQAASLPLGSGAFLIECAESLEAKLQDIKL